MRAQFFKTGKSLRPSAIENSQCLENKNMMTPVGKKKFKLEKIVFLV